ncbi:MAG TPA: LLM class flavin-dependent oxidoreductase [Chloroflexota bacterium]|jgi:alkanesulfonate monooxygenase SsuD/methylene tetrahydromethanopterin reductase-like flavin-dependent oxidoreductase (luciferase family)
MRFGAYAMPTYREEFGLTEAEFLKATLKQLARAEELGFDSLWVNEHHFHQYGGLMPSLPTMLAALSQHTSTARLGTSVVLLPLYNPLHVAEELAMVDLLSDGRLELGVGRGFIIHDYEVMGVPSDDAQDRLMEALDVVRKAWTTQPFSHSGKYYQVNNVSVWPQPVQRPHPPIWIACSRTPSSFEWVGTQGHKLLTLGYMHPVEKLGELTKIYREAREAAGATGEPIIATHYHVVVAEDGAEARRIAESGLAEHVRMNRAAQLLASAPPPPANEGISIDQLVDEGRLIAGDPDDCARMLRRFGEVIGCREAHCMFQFGDVPFATAQRSMDLFAAHVIPQLSETAVAAS